MERETFLNEKREQLLNLKSELLFKDDGLQKWQNNWFLDGLRSKVENTERGLLLESGNIVGDNASHCVLWTKESFSGDLKIELDYTRIDTINKGVNIFYIHATGTNEGQFSKDISKWNDYRMIPFMKHYFENLNSLHISFAAWGNNDDAVEDYIRARRYPVRPDIPFDKTDLAPDNFDTGLFIPGITYHISLIKKGNDLFMNVKNEEIDQSYHWDTTQFEDVNEGRFGIRQMWLRCNLYKNITISKL